MTKQSSIQIHDSKGGKYRVKSVGKNGEILQTSEPLNTAANVKKHILAMDECWESFAVLNIIDHTKAQKFAKTGYAQPAKK